MWTYAASGRLLCKLASSSGASLVGLDFDSARAWPVYNWMGPCKAPLRSLNGYLARDLGTRGIRANLVVAGPLRTRAASGITDFDVLVDRWSRQEPLAWESRDLLSSGSGCPTASRRSQSGNELEKLTDAVGLFNGVA